MKKLLLVLSLVTIGLSGCYVKHHDNGYHRGHDHDHHQKHKGHDKGHDHDDRRDNDNKRY